MAGGSPCGLHQSADKWEVVRLGGFGGGDWEAGCTCSSEAGAEEGEEIHVSPSSIKRHCKPGTGHYPILTLGSLNAADVNIMPISQMRKQGE